MTSKGMRNAAWALAGFGVIWGVVRADLTGNVARGFGASAALLLLAFVLWAVSKALEEKEKKEREQKTKKGKKK